MAESLRNPDELQKQLNDFQGMQRQLQIIAAQRQQLVLQAEEMKMAEAELGKTDKAVYRAVGPLLLQTTKTEATGELKERRELFETRASILAKQEEKMRPKFDELRATLEKALRENKLSK